MRLWAGYRLTNRLWVGASARVPRGWVPFWFLVGLVVLPMLMTKCGR